MAESTSLSPSDTKERKQLKLRGCSQEVRAVSMTDGQHEEGPSARAGAHLSAVQDNRVAFFPPNMKVAAKGSQKICMSKKTSGQPIGFLWSL